MTFSFTLPVPNLMPLAVAVACGALAGCGGAKTWPTLVPQSQIIGPETQADPDLGPDLKARGDALRTRADALRRETP